MNRRTRKPVICATSIAAFLAAGSISPGDTFTVDLGDTTTFSSPVTGDLTKFGLGTLKLDTVQTYAGPTQIHGGTLVVDSTSFPVNSAISVFGHTTQGTTAGQLAISGTYAPQTFTFGSQAFFAGGGPGGNGVALLNVGNNTLSGGMATSSTGVTRLGTGFGMATITSLAVSGGVSTVQTTALQNGGNVASNWTISGLSGANGSLLQKQSNNTLILSGDNSSYLGAIDLNGGFVRVSAANNLGGTVAANAINFNNATLEVRTEGAGLDFGTGANSRGVSLASNNGTINLDRAVGGSGLAQTVTFGNLTLAANRNLTVNSRNGYGVQFGTGLGAGAGQNTITNNGNGTVIFTGNVFGTADGTARILTLATANANSDITIQGNITATSTNAHSISKTGTGTLTILGTAGTYSGQTNIQNGTLTARTFRSIGNSSVAANILLGETTTTGTLNMIGAAGSGAIPVLTGTAARNFTLNGTTGGGRINANQSGSAANALVIAGNVSNVNATAKNLTLGGTSTLENEISGNIIDSTSTAGSGISLVKTNSGTWVLSGTGNNYTGTTTIQNGTLKLKSNASNLPNLPSTSAILFNVDGDQNAGGTLELTGAASTVNTQSLGSLTPTQGANTVRVAPGAGGNASLTFASLGGASSIGNSINFVSPGASDTITITAQPSGYVRAATYYNGTNFAYSAAGVLRAPLYGDGLGGGGTDVGFVTGSTLTSALHNEITGATASGAVTIASLKISGSQTVTLSGLLGINAGSGTSGGIVVTGGLATITGGSVSQGFGNAASGGAGLVIRVDGASDQLNLNSPITNSTTGGLTKNGAGTLVLSSGANAYAGGTIINEGTIQLAGAAVMGAANGATIIRQGATLDVNGLNTGTRIGAFNGAGVVTNNGSVAGTLTVGNGNGTGTFSGVIQNGSAASALNVVKQGTGGQTWSGLNTYTGSTTINSTGIVSVPNLANIGFASGIGAGSTSANAASLVFGGASATFATGGISYTGNASTSTDRLFTFGATANAGSGARIQANGANNASIVFSNPGAAAYAAGAASTVAQTLTLGGASTGDNQMNILLANSGAGGSATLGVQKADAGTWALTGANTYTGTTTISGGRLIAVDGLGLPATSPLVLSGGVLESSGTFSRNLNTATIPAAGSGGVRWNSTQGTAIASGGFAASSSKLTVFLNTGAPNLTWATDGFMTNVGSAAASATMILNSTTALAEVEFQNNIELGTSTIARVIQVDDNGTTTTDFATLSGVLSGATTGTTGSGINKTGAGVLQLLGANTHAGLTTLSAGTLVVRDFGASTSASSNLGAGTAVLRLGGGTLTYAGAGESTNRTIHLNASTTLDGSGTGGLVITSTILNAGSAAKTLTLQGLKAGGNEITSVLTDATAGTGVLTVTKGGGGTWVLSGNNTYTGTTNVGSGNLGAGSDTAFGTGTLSVTNGNIFADGGDRTLANVTNLSQNATGGVIGVNSLTLSGPVNVGNGGNSNVNNFLDAGKQLEFTNTVTNADTGAARTLVMGGLGTTVFTGTIQDDTSTNARALGFTLSSGTVVFRSSTGNNYAGTTTINGGTLQLAGGSGNLIQHGAGKGNVVFGNTVFAATLDLNGQSETINGLTGTSTGAKAIDNTSASAASLSFGGSGTASQAVNFNGNITQTGTGPVSLTKTGTAAGTLSGTTMSFTGTIEVQTGGSLAFTGADPTGTTGITVAGGAGLSFLNGLGNPISALALLNLGAGSGITTLGLNLGDPSISSTWDTLTTSVAAVTANIINFDLVGLTGFGAGTYDLLSSPLGGLDGAAGYNLSSAPGGYSYSISTTANLVQLIATALPGARVFWTGDQDSSWPTLNAGPETNWADSTGAEYGSSPGPLDTVIFSSQISTGALPVGPVVFTTLDGNFPVDSLEFNGQVGPGGTAAANVHIASGTPTNSTLTISPASPANGILIPNASGTASIAALVALGADQTWSVGTATGNLGAALTVSGVMSGTGNLTKTGIGTATITGNNTRTGKTAINGGTLAVNGEAALGVASTAAVADQLSFDGGTLRFTAVTTIDDANRGVTINAGGATMDMNGSSGTFASNIVIAGPGGITKIGGNNLGLLGANTYGGGTTINGGLVVVGNNTGLGSGAALLNASGVILEVRDAVNVGNTLTVSNTGNEKTLRLQTGATTGEFSGPIAVDETSAGNFRVSAAAGGTLTISGAITSQTGTTASGIRKEGAGTVLLSGANALNGPSSIAAGILRHGANNVLASTTAVTVHGTGGATATLDLNGFNQTIGSLTFNGGGGNAASVNSVTTGAGTLALGGNVTVNVNGNQTIPASIDGNLSLNANRTFNVGNSTGSATDLLISAVISNGSAAGGLLKLGAGTLQLTAANTYTGVSSVGAGVLQHGADSVLVPTASVLVSANSTTPAVFDLNGFNQTIGALTLGGTGGIVTSNNSVTTGAGTLALGGNVTVTATGNWTTGALISGNMSLNGTRTFTVANSTGTPTDLVVSALVSDGSVAGNVVKAGPGTMVLSGANTYTGTTTVNAGALSISSDNNLGTAPGSPVANQLSLNAGTLETTATFSGDANRGITLGASGGTIATSVGTYTVPAIVAGSGALTKTGAGTLELSGSGANTYSGLTRVTAGTLDLNKTPGTNAIVGDGASIKATADILINGGTLRLLADDQLADSVTIDITSGTLDFNNRNEVLFNLINSGGTVNYGTGDVTIDDPTWSGGTNTISGNTTFGSLFISAGTNTVTGTGSGGPGRLRIGTVTTPGPIDFTGNNNTPSLVLNSDNATPGTLQFAAGLNVSLLFTGTGTSTGTISSAGADSNKGRIDLNGSTRAFNIGDAAGSATDMTIGADIFDSAAAAAGVDKTGAGTLLLSGSSTYTGDTNVNAGSVLVTGSVTGDVRVNNTGTLGGTGSVGALHANSGGTVSPGLSIGTLTASAATLNAGSNFILEVSPSTLSNDNLVVTNSVILDLVTSPTLVVTIDGPDTVLTIGQTLPFMTYAAYNGGLFQVLGDVVNQYDGNPFTTDFFTVGGNSFAIDYILGGNSIALVAVPEPSAMASLLGGVGLLVGLQRARRRRK